MGRLSLTEEKIRNTFIEMLGEMPMNAIRVTALANRAHIDRTTFYIYYDSLYDVLQQMEDNYLDGLVAGMQQDERYLHEPSPGMLKNLNYAKQNLDILRLLLGPHGDSTFHSRMMRVLRQSYRAATKRTPHSDTYYRMIEEFFIAGEQGLFRYWVSHSTDIRMEEFAILLYRFFDKLQKCLLDSRP